MNAKSHRKNILNVKINKFLIHFVNQLSIYLQDFKNQRHIVKHSQKQAIKSQQHATTEIISQHASQHLQNYLHVQLH